MNENLILILAGFLGVIGHSLIKAQSIQKDAKVGNVNWKLTDYLRYDYIGISLSFVAVFIWLIVFPEAALKYPKLETWIRTSFVAMGGLGSYILQTFFSVSKKYIRNKVNLKTDQLDEIKEEIKSKEDAKD